MNIVHIGSGTTESEIDHIAAMREAGHSYFVPGDSTHEQTVRRIMDADEIHIWDMTREFDLGLVYFFSVEALHHKLHWRIKIFDDRGPRLALFRKIQRDQEAAVYGRRQLVESVRLGETVFTPVPVKAATRTPPIKVEVGENGHAVFTLPCAESESAVPCRDCDNLDECKKLRDRLRLEDAKHES